uniref:hypothetical protein n=1 Tax=Arthrobacter sp. JCM 19049 TaxID=1460643 RepID=UPI002436F1A1
WLSVLLGLLLGALHVLLHFFTPQRSLTSFWVLCAAAAVAITVLALGYRRLHRVLPAGFGRRYWLPWPPAWCCMPGCWP